MNILSFGFSFCVFMWVLKISFRLLLIFNFLGAPCFAVVGYTVFCSRSMSLTFRLQTSMGRSPVSLLNVSFTVIIFPELAINMFMFVVVGIRMDFGSW